MANAPYWFKGPPVIASSIGNNLSAPIVLTALPAGHAPGFYTVYAIMINRTAPTAGTVTRSVAFSTPGVGATTAASATPITVTQGGHAGGLGIALGTFYSDGTAAVVVTLTPASVTGSPVSDFYVFATMEAMGG